MLVGVNYPEKPIVIPAVSGAKISPVAVNLDLNSPYKWKMDTLKISSSQENGIKASIVTETSYSSKAVVHFTGTPAKAKETVFTVSGTVVDEKNAEVLTGVSKRIRIIPADSEFTRIEKIVVFQFIVRSDLVEYQFSEPRP